MLDEYRRITRDIKSNRYSKIEMAVFLASCAKTAMERDEVWHLTRAMVETGKRLHWSEPLVADNTALATSRATGPVSYHCLPGTCLSCLGRQIQLDISR
jgi:hypothetical protein